VTELADKKEKKSAPYVPPADTPAGTSDIEEFFRSLQSGRPKMTPDKVDAAFEAAQRFADESDVENASSHIAQELAHEPNTIACKVCGYRNRDGNKFCAMCGVAVARADKPASGHAAAGDTRASTALAVPADPFPDPAMRPPATQPTGNETHHYHHHYHHHYFPGAQEGGMYPRAAESGREIAREDKLRSSTMALRGDMSRAEASVRAITQEWVLACNTKHLDDLLDLYVSDALVLRSNYPTIRGAAAVREFFFGALDAGLGEVEIDPMRVEVAGDLAYEAGRCKALIPSSSGKRREERGKYLWVLQKQSNGGWKLVADCWSSDLALSTLESDIPANAVVKTSSVPRKNP